jgi:hypothetical protein
MARRGGVWEGKTRGKPARSHTPARRFRFRWNPCYVLGTMLSDLMTAFLVAFAAVTTSGLISRIWEYF